MIMDYVYLFLFFGLLSLFFAGVISWGIIMYVEKILCKCDMKMNQEVERLSLIDGFEINWIDIAAIRKKVCRKEVFYLFLLVFCTSYISLFAGAIYIIRSPSFWGN
jgi:hypothetical protein